MKKVDKVLLTGAIVAGAFGLGSQANAEEVGTVSNPASSVDAVEKVNQTVTEADITVSEAKVSKAEAEVKAMIRDSNDAGNDGIFIVHYNMDDIDLPTLKAYRNRFRSSSVKVPFITSASSSFVKFCLTICSFSSGRHSPSPKIVQ